MMENDGNWMKQKIDTKFKKGQVANPKGKAKGVLNKSTLRFSKLKSLASDRYEDAFKMLWGSMEIGEGWAFQIYFKELVPKKTFEQKIIIQDQDGQNRREAIIAALPGFTELTHEEALEELKVFKNAELPIQEDKEIPIGDILSDDQIKIIHGWVEEKKNAKQNY